MHFSFPVCTLNDALVLFFFISRPDEFAVLFDKYKAPKYATFPVIYNFALLRAYPFSKVINIGSKTEIKITT